MNFITNLENKLIEKAKLKNKTIVLPEAYFSTRILKAGIKCAKNNICNIVLLTDNDSAFDDYNLGKYDNIKVVNILTDTMAGMLADALYMKRKDKGLTIDDAKEQIKDAIYFATMMVELSLVDGLVAGAEISTSRTFRPALQVIKGKTATTKISSFFVMAKKEEANEKIYVLSDCGMNINPTAEDIADFAVQSANSARSIAGIEPKVALLCYSTKGSAQGECADKMKKAYNLLTKQSVDFDFDGELQLDAAIVKEVAKLKCPNSKVAGVANVLIFPDLQSGNIGYKLMQRFGGYSAIGPIAQGMAKPINDVSRGASVDEIVLTIAITCLQ